MYLYLFRFSKKIGCRFLLNQTSFFLLNNKKTLFFKKKYNPKILVSKRLSIVLRKRKKLKNFRNKKTEKGNFFFKKFFYKILLKNRKFLRRFFFFNNKTRQKKLTKHIFFTTKFTRSGHNVYEFSLLNVLMRSHFCFSMTDAIGLIKNRFLFINGVVVTQHDYNVKEYDFLQVHISKYVYKYMQSLKVFLKRKLSAFRLNSWKFFKQKFFKQQQQLKPQKRKTPKNLYLFFLFRLDVPKYLEVDYFTLSIFILKQQVGIMNTTYFFNKFFSNKLFSLYNFKKFN